MGEKTNLILLAAICGSLILLSAWGIGWYGTSGLLRGDADGILLLAICGLIGSVFSVQLFLIARRAGWLTLQRKPAASRTTATESIVSPARQLSSNSSVIARGPKQSRK